MFIFEAKMKICSEKMNESAEICLNMRKILLVKIRQSYKYG